MSAMIARRRLCTCASALRQSHALNEATLHSNAWLTLPLTAETPRIALVLLNTPPRPAAALRTLWSLSSYRVCADAAANRLLDSVQLALGEEGLSGGPAEMQRRLQEQQRVSRQHHAMLPDVVTGDFDSIRPDVLHFYESRGCQIAHNPSQVLGAPHGPAALRSPALARVRFRNNAPFVTLAGEHRLREGAGPRRGARGKRP
jgi:hypothetical protein